MAITPVGNTANNYTSGGSGNLVDSVGAKGKAAKADIMNKRCET
jgi:hypothetical protein